MYQENLAKIEESLERNSQNRNKVTLVAVSKTRSASEVLAVHKHGVRHFGENYVQEALDKQIEVDAAGTNDIIWHLIGPLQSNKAKLVAGKFAWLHTLTNDKQARLIHRNRPSSLPAINVCIQVNIDQAPTKNGLTADVSTIATFVELLQGYTQLSIRGLMVMPDATTDAKLQEGFDASKALFDAVKAELFCKMPEIAEKFDTLSMGMSTDYLFAIEAGSTMVRIGTALFGPRR